MKWLALPVTAFAFAVGVVERLPAQAAAIGASSGIYTAAQAGRGKAIYGARCAKCHGGTLAGADVVPPLAGSRFLSNWSGQSVAALATRIRTTMPPDDPDPLGSAQSADVVAYLLQANDFRPGAAELPASPRQLVPFRIDVPGTGR